MAVAATPIRAITPNVEALRPGDFSPPAASKATKCDVRCASLKSGQAAGDAGVSDASGADLADGLAHLAVRIRAGDRVAEHELGAHYTRAIRAIVRRHCRPGEPQVEDIAQDILADILKRLREGAIDDPRALPHYLQISIRNACTAWYKREQRLQPESEEAIDTDRHSDPVDLNQHRQRQHWIRALLDELPMRRDRELLRRFYLLEESRESVCAALGIDIHHFHRVVHRARERMRIAMNRHGIDDL